MQNPSKRDFKFCLLDTNILSEITKNKQNELNNYISKFITKQYLPCIAIWSILELRKNPEIYNSFINVFSFFPFCILKPYYFLIKEEMDYYPNFKKIKPTIFEYNPLKHDSLHNI